MNEHDIQREAVDLLRDEGYIVCVTSNRRHTANTKGTPDVLVALHSALWLGLEFKQPGGKLTQEQETLYAHGNIRVVTSAKEALKAVKFAERNHVTIKHTGDE